MAVNQDSFTMGNVDLSVRMGMKYQYMIYRLVQAMDTMSMFANYGDLKTKK